MTLVGRVEESRALGRLLAGVRLGEPGALVLGGDAGIGKTALLDDMVESATDFEVTRVVGVESEVRLGYAGLHQLLNPFLGRLAGLPAPQADALGRAFGVTEGPAPDRFLIRLAAVSLLVHAAASKPLLCVIDDAQWLDRDSLELLAFAARRLHATRVAMVFSLRSPDESRVEVHGLAQLRLAELSDAAAHELLDTAHDERLQAGVGARLVAVAVAGGKPLALIGLPAPAHPLGRVRGPGGIARGDLRLLRVDADPGLVRSRDPDLGVLSGALMINVGFLWFDIQVTARVLGALKHVRELVPAG